MLFYGDIHSSCAKKRVKDSIHKHDGKVSDIVSPDISLIVSDKAKNEKATRPLDASRSNAGMKRSYRMLQKALEQKHKQGLENKTQLFADKNDMDIYSSEKFIELVKEGVLFDKETFPGSRSAKIVGQKETEFQQPTQDVKSKNCFRIRKMAARCTSPVRRLFNRNSRVSPNSLTPNAERKLQHNFVKVEDESREMRPLHKVNVFKKMVFCRCKPGVFHSTHVDMIESSHPSCPTKSSRKDLFKYVNLRGYCEICACNYTCLWNHITGYIHKENVSRTSYSQIDHLSSRFPTIDEFLENHCPVENPSGAETSNDTVSVKTPVSSKTDIEALDCKSLTNVLANSDSSRFQNNYEMNLFCTSSNNEELYCKSDLHAAVEIGSTVNVSESTVRPHENKPPTLSVPDRQIQLPLISSKLLQSFFDDFLPGQIRKRIENLLIYLENSIEYSDMHTNVPARFDPVDKNLYLALVDLNTDVFSIDKLYCEAVRKFLLSLKKSYQNPVRYSKDITNSENKYSEETDIALNASSHSLIEQLWKPESGNIKSGAISNGRLLELLSELPDNLRSRLVIQENLSRVSSSSIDYISESYNHGFLDFTESNKNVQQKSESRETNELDSLLLKENRLHNRTSDLHSVLRPNIHTAESIKIEPITNEKVANEKMAKGEPRVMTKIQNGKIENKAYEMTKPEYENEESLLEACVNEFVPVKLTEVKENAGKDIINKTENEQATRTLLEDLNSDELNDQGTNSKSLIVRLRKVLLTENKSYVSISPVRISQAQLKYEYLHTPDYEVTQSKPKKKLGSNAKVKRSPNALSKKTDRNIWSSSLLGQSFQTPSYCRLDKLVIKKYRIPSDLKASSYSAQSTPEIGKGYSFYIVNQRKSRIVMAFHRIRPFSPIVDELEPGDTKENVDHKIAIEEETTSQLKQSDGEFPSRDAENIDFERNYQFPNVFPILNSAYNASRKLEFRTNGISKHWNIKANYGLRLILCRA